MAEAMAWILDHPDEVKKMGKRGREDMVNYDVPHILKLYESLYSDVLSQKMASTDQSSLRSHKLLFSTNMTGI